MIPATFQSSLASKGEETICTETVRDSAFSSVKDGLESADVAKIVKHGIDKKRDVIYIPRIKARMFLILEAIAPGIFGKLFK